MPGATPYYSKAKDVFIQRRTSDGHFEEYGITVRPSSWLTTDACNNLVMSPFSSFSASVADSASYATSASWAPMPLVSDSASWASSSISSSYTETFSWAINAINDGALS